MNKLITFLCMLLLTASIWAQSPEKMSYQAVVRDEGNKLLINRPVGAKMSIVQGSDNGNTVYSEIFNPNPETNANGLLTLEIGGGIPESGTFSEIDWSKGPYFIRTEIDPSGGSNYTVTGTSQLLSVPFALHAKTVEFDKVDDADNDPTNEIQQLSLSGTSLSLSRGGGTVTLPSGFSLPYEGNVSSSGNAFSVENKGSGGGILGSASSGTGVIGVATGNDLLSLGVRGTSSSSFGRGVSGYATSTTGFTFGVEGASDSNRGIGVNGVANSTTGFTSGVRGVSSSSAGRGVFGFASSTTGTTSGVRGESWSSAGQGVFGFANSTTGTTDGVRGESSSSSGHGVFGWASSTTGINYGVRGVSESNSGIGVHGVASSTTGAAYGVWGSSSSSSGRGVYGETTNATGFSGYFTGGKFYVSGRTGINTESPVTTLHVRHGTLGQNVPPTEGLRLHNSGASNNSWTLYTVNSNGNLQLYANNALRGTFSATNGVYTSSSNRRLKTDITALNENILERVLQLQTVSYRFISHPQSTPTIGFIAEDALPLFPELVETTGENDENLGVNYAAFSVVAIKAIQQQQKKIAELEEALRQQTQSLQYHQKQMEALLTDNEQLKKRLERIESFMASTAEY